MKNKDNRGIAEMYQTMELMSDSQRVYSFAGLFYGGRELIFLVIIQNHKAVSLCYRIICYRDRLATGSNSTHQECISASSPPLR